MSKNEKEVTLIGNAVLTPRGVNAVEQLQESADMHRTTIRKVVMLSLTIAVEQSPSQKPELLEAIAELSIIDNLIGDIATR